MDLEQVKDLLPETIQQIAELIGYPATICLVKHLGGTTFPISKGLRTVGNVRYDLLEKTIGTENSDKLAGVFGGEDFYIPRCAEALRELRNRQFVSEFDTLKNEGTSALMALTTLCPKFGFSDRLAWELLERYGRTQTSSQSSLF